MLSSASRSQRSPLYTDITTDTAVPLEGSAIGRCVMACNARVPSQAGGVLLDHRRSRACRADFGGATWDDASRSAVESGRASSPFGGADAFDQRRSTLHDETPTPAAAPDREPDAALARPPRGAVCVGRDGRAPLDCIACHGRVRGGYARPGFRAEDLRRFSQHEGVRPAQSARRW
jgi:hypothetical protein